MGDLTYGVDDVNVAKFPDDTYLSSQNQDSVQQYVCTTVELISHSMNIFFVVLAFESINK